MLYPIEAVPATFQDVLALNPLTPILELARMWVIDPGAPGPVEAAGVWLGCVIPFAIFVALCVLAAWVFNREAPLIAEEL